MERQRSKRSHVSCQKPYEDLGSSEVICNLQSIPKSWFCLLVIDVREVECIVQFAVMQRNMVVGAMEPRDKPEKGSAHPIGKPFGEQPASVRSVGWAGKGQRLQLVCTACKLSKSIIKSKECQIHDPV